MAFHDVLDDRQSQPCAARLPAAGRIDAVKSLYARWEQDSQNIHAELDELKRENQNLQRKISSQDESNAELKRNNERLQAYLCQKDPRAPFCGKPAR